MFDPPEYLTTKELADLLRTRERKIYDLAASGEIPCTRATGKLLFPKSSVMHWLQSNQVGLQSTMIDKPAPNVFLGSHDPLLFWALQASNCGIATIFDGSVAGLNSFVSGKGLASGMHIYEPATNSWNKNTVHEATMQQSVVLTKFCTRTRGILFSLEKHNRPKDIRDIQNLSFVQRQPLSGAQLLLDHHLNYHDIKSAHINYTDLAHNETDAALGVVNGRADIAIGLQCMAIQFQLGFVPIVHEEFDLLVDRQAWFESGFQTFWKFCQTKEFLNRAETMPGYDISSFGKIRYNSQ